MLEATCIEIQVSSVACSPWAHTWSRGSIGTPHWESNGGWKVWGERANEERPFLVQPRSS